MQKEQPGKEKIAYYRLCLSPFIGLVTGVALHLFHLLCVQFGFGQTCFALAGTALLVLISMGVYLKDFMLVSEKLAFFIGEKLEKFGRVPVQDAAPGVYGTIAAIAYSMLYAGGLSVVWKSRQLVLLTLGYIIARTLYSMAFVWFPQAEAQGLWQVRLSETKKRMLRIILSVILALCFCTCIMISPIIGVLEALLCMWVWTYYYYMSKRINGGNTEEMAGYFLALCELMAVLFIGLFGRVLL
ncbi:MAG: adenosylcobinamide-GDP ribazoletransferase [Lachnospiraceae bacterium]|nr:adenosylcobinamide-GDP ribazoletransferase [Lachnospiraceae bacterium]